MKQFEKIFKREDETEARILITDSPSTSCVTPHYSCDVFSRNIGESKWNLVCDTPKGGQTDSMEFSEFIKGGENPIFAVVSVRELIDATGNFFELYHPDLSAGLDDGKEGDFSEPEEI